MDKAPERLHIYIDESSTLGLKRNEPYFVVCALILSELEKKPIKNTVRDIVATIAKNKPFDELHASHMNFTEKEWAHNKFKGKDFSLSYIIVHKESIHENLYKKKNICFNYFVSLALKKIIEKTHLKDIFITIDTRSVKVTSEKSLEEYLNTQLAENGIYHKNVTVQYGDSKNYSHLQAVDLFANAVYAKYNFGKNHFYSYFSSKIVHRELFPQHHFDTKYPNGVEY